MPNQKQDQIEIWRDVDGFEDSYQVSNLGRVRSLDRITTYAWKGSLRSKITKGRVLRPGTTGFGYPVVFLYRANQCHARLVHRLVMRAFVGRCPDGLVVCHNDGDATNSALWNLRYDTHRANYEDSVRHGTAQVGEKSPTAKLTPDRVRIIRSAPEGIQYLRTLADAFGVTTLAIRRAQSGETWAHIQPHA